MHTLTSITTQQWTTASLIAFIGLTVYAYAVARGALRLYRETEDLLSISEMKVEQLTEENREEVHRRISTDNVLRERGVSLEVERRRFDHLLGIDRDQNARQRARNGNPYSVPGS